LKHQDDTYFHTFCPFCFSVKEAEVFDRTIKKYQILTNALVLFCYLFTDAVARASAIARAQQGGRKQPPAKKTRGRGAKKTVAL
jgi:hypothetical protein